MTKLQSDFLGPFLECGGSITRPSDISPIASAGAVSLTIKQIIYTPTFRVRDGLGAEETWYDCGNTAAYKEARDTLPKEDFERFCLFACGPELARLGGTPYEGLRALFPKGYVDYLDPAFRAHMALEKSLSAAFVGRLNAAYAAKHGLPKPTGLAEPKMSMPASTVSVSSPVIGPAQCEPTPQARPHKSRRPT